MKRNAELGVFTKSSKIERNPMTPAVTRFPPSPTGALHVGGARTALFNWLYARRMEGKFILRIEDTDTERSTQASVDAIFDALEWLGLDWDEGPYFQTQRYPIYREHVQMLLDAGRAYYCACRPEEVERMRRAAMASGGKPKYDGTCRRKQLAAGAGRAVRFKAPLSGTTVLEDVVKGNIVFQNEELDDFVICRSDDTPTYNFAVVVDDITMGVNTIIRGDDHVMNTPKQIQLYKAFEAPLPLFGHVPMVLGKDRTRLSKRHGATSVTAYRDMGYSAAGPHQLPGPPGMVPRRPGVFHAGGADPALQSGGHRTGGRGVRRREAIGPERRPHQDRSPCKPDRPARPLPAGEGGRDRERSPRREGHRQPERPQQDPAGNGRSVPVLLP
jgi:hypothetical protein